MGDEGTVMPRTPKIPRTKMERNERRIDRFRLMRPENERFSVVQLWARARKLPFPEEMLPLSNAELAAKFNVEAKYGRFIRAALEEASDVNANGAPDVWAKWQEHKND